MKASTSTLRGREACGLSFSRRTISPSWAAARERRYSSAAVERLVVKEEWVNRCLFAYTAAASPNVALGAPCLVMLPVGNVLMGIGPMIAVFGEAWWSVEGHVSKV